MKINIPPSVVVSTTLNVTETTVPDIPVFVSAVAVELAVLLMVPTTALVCTAMAPRAGTVTLNTPVLDTVYLSGHNQISALQICEWGNSRDAATHSRDDRAIDDIAVATCG